VAVAGCAGRQGWARPGRLACEQGGFVGHRALAGEAGELVRQAVGGAGRWGVHDLEVQVGGAELRADTTKPVSLDQKAGRASLLRSPSGCPPGRQISRIVWVLAGSAVPGPAEQTEGLCSSVRNRLALPHRHRVSPSWIAGMACLNHDGFRGNLDAYRGETIMGTPIPIRREALEATQDRGEAGGPASPKVCVVGASGKLGRYMVRLALDRGYEVVAVCREVSVDKLEEFSGRITIIPGATDDRQVIERAVAGCAGVLTVLVARGVRHYSSGTAQAVLDHARPGARLVFSCGYHITRDGQDVYSWKVKALVKVAGRIARLFRLIDLDDQVEACQRIFASDTR
jgi:NAD(P)H-binding